LYFETSRREKQVEGSSQLMRIGYDAKRLFNNRGGLASYARTLILSLRSYYPNVIIYLYTTRIKTPFDMSEIIDDPDIIIRTYKGPFSWYWRSKGLVKQLLNDRIQIYHGLACELPIGIDNTNIKTIVTIHDALWKYHKNDYGITDRMILNKKLSYALDKSDHFICVSQSTLMSLSSYDVFDDTKVTVIEPIAGPEFYMDSHQCQVLAEDYDLPPRFILAVGNKKRRKNIAFLVESLQYLKTDNVELVIVGNEAEYTRKVIQISGLEYHELPCLYKLADLCVYPSINEGFGLPILESILSGTPVLAMDKAPMNRLNSELLYLFPYDASPKDLAVFLDETLMVGADKSHAGLENQITSKNYSTTHFELYHSLLA